MISEVLLAQLHYPPTSGLLSAFVRTLFVWWCVAWYVNQQYRTCKAGLSDAAGETTAVHRSTQRSQSWRLTRGLLAGWGAGGLLILFSALPQLRSLSGREIPPVLVAFLICFGTLSIVFTVGEVAENRWVRRCLKTLGWVLAAVGTLLFYQASASGSRPSLLREAVYGLAQHSGIWITGLAAFVVVFPVGEWIGAFMQRWTQDALPEQGLPEGGKWIGRLERLLIVLCLIAGQPAGVAILVTAKGALRFGEIRQGMEESRQRKLIEYILIGSMLSYTCALSIGWIASALIDRTPQIAF